MACTLSPVLGAVHLEELELELPPFVLQMERKPQLVAASVHVARPKVSFQVLQHSFQCEALWFGGNVCKH
jgi:hypothetical protein